MFFKILIICYIKYVSVYKNRNYAAIKVLQLILSNPKVRKKLLSRSNTMRT